MISPIQKATDQPRSVFEFTIVTLTALLPLAGVMVKPAFGGAVGMAIVAALVYGPATIAGLMTTVLSLKQEAGSLIWAYATGIGAVLATLVCARWWSYLASSGMAAPLSSHALLRSLMMAALISTVPAVAFRTLIRVQPRKWLALEYALIAWIAVMAWTFLTAGPRILFDL